MYRVRERERECVCVWSAVAVNPASGLEHRYLLLTSDCLATKSIDVTGSRA